MSRIPKFTVDSVLTYQRLNAMRDRLEALRSMLLVDHGYDGNVFSSAESRLGRHSSRTLSDSSVSHAGLYVISGTLVVFGGDDIIGTPFIDDAGCTVVPFRALANLSADASIAWGPTVSPPPTPPTIVVAHCGPDSSSGWPWLVRVLPPSPSLKPITSAPFTFGLKVWGS